MKRFKIFLVLLLAFALTGCIQKYDYTEERSDAVAEYMASLLLKYDTSYDQALVPKEDLFSSSPQDTGTDAKDTSADTEASTVTSSTAATDTPSAAGNEYSLADVMGTKSFDVEYTGYKLADTYPEDADSAGFTLTPRNGYQLLIAEFTVKNTSDKKQELNLIDSDINYQLDINVGTVYKPLLTLLQNDLQYLDITIGGGESEIVLLIFEISKDVDMSNVSLIVSKDNESNVIEIN